MATWKLMSADACGDAGKATKYPDSASDEDDGKCICIYKCVDVHVCEIAVTWAIYRKIAHSRVRENFTRPHLCHSPITICPPMTLALWVGRIMDKFARFMGEFWHNSPDFWAIFQYSPYGVRISKIGRWLLWKLRPHLYANHRDWGDLSHKSPTGGQGKISISHI